MTLAVEENHQGQLSLHLFASLNTSPVLRLRKGVFLLARTGRILSIMVFLADVPSTCGVGKC